ncbi:uracil-DNA glycosylase [Buchnera aphidicola]|uniref:uracil-DNA glycosylase n=1 Tax=Buchnera aphidicola TaxID=9 RepID=UPI003463D0CD
MTWQDLFLKTKNWIKLLHIIQKKRKHKIIYPIDSKIFQAFFLTPFNLLKVVILGQDPYCQFNQANGLAFSVNKGVKIPPSLINIYQELKNDLKQSNIAQHGCLDYWAKQGVFLLNTILTVEHGKPGSHIDLGWKYFTNQVIRFIDQNHIGIVFLLWGNQAISTRNIICSGRNYILTASHPSPLSVYRSFFGCRHFSKTNKILVKNKIKPIDWLLN